VATRKPFLLRVEPGLLAALEQWAADDLRSVNGQIEFLLREALRRAGRKVAPADEPAVVGDDAADADDGAAAQADAPATAPRRKRPA
jgi:hypothetical protein